MKLMEDKKGALKMMLKPKKYYRMECLRVQKRNITSVTVKND